MKKETDRTKEDLTSPAEEQMKELAPDEDVATEKDTESHDSVRVEALLKAVGNESTFSHRT